jgi:beta-glucosidase
MTVRLDARAFTYYDVTGHQWRADAGEFAVLVGSSSAQIELKGTVTLKSDVTIAPGS